MVDTCTITRDTEVFVNEDTGGTTRTTATIYSGKCRIQQRTPAGARPADVGEAYRLMLGRELQLPMATSAGIKVGDKVTMTASRDADLVGKTFRVRELAGKTDATARRLGVEEVT